MGRTVSLLTLTAALILAACAESGTASPTEADSETLTTLTGPAKTGAAADPSTAVASSITSATPPEDADQGEGALPDYAIVARVTAGVGDTLVVLLDPTSYDTLTDIDLENVIADVFELFAPVYEVHVVDSQAAADLVLEVDIDQEQRTVLDEHYFVRLEEGYRIIYQGPYAATPESILGS